MEEHICVLVNCKICVFHSFIGLKYNNMHFRLRAKILHAVHLIHVSMYTNDPLQPDGCKLSVLLTFRIISTSIRRHGNVVSMEASIDGKVFYVCNRMVANCLLY